MDQKPDPLSVRLPAGMRDRLRARAAANRRSMNAEVIHYLDRALDEAIQSERSEEAAQ